MSRRPNTRVPLPAQLSPLRGDPASGVLSPETLERMAAELHADDGSGSCARCTSEQRSQSPGADPVRLPCAGYEAIVAGGLPNPVLTKGYSTVRSQVDVENLRLRELLFEARLLLEEHDGEEWELRRKHFASQITDLEPVE